MHSSADIRRENRIAFWAFFCLAVIYNFDSFLLGKYSLVSYADFLDSSFVINLRFYGKLLLEQGIFNWFQPLLGGMPALVSMQPSWTLRSLMAELMPMWMVMAFIKTVTAGLAGYGMFRLLRSYFGADRRIGVVAGIIYFMACPWTYNFIWMCYFPLSLVHVDELNDPRTGLGGRLGRLLLFYAFALSSLPVLTLPEFSVGHFAFVLLFDRSGERLKHLAVVVLLWTGYLLTFVPYMLDLFQYVPDVSRVYDIRYTGLWDALVSLTKISALVRDYVVMGLGIFLLPMLRHSALARKALSFAVVPLLLCVLLGSDFIYGLKDSFIIKMDLGHSIQLFYFGGVLFCGLALQSMRERGCKPNVVWAVVAVLLLRIFCNEAQIIRDGAVIAFALVTIFFKSGNIGRKEAVVLAGTVACLVFSLLIMKQREELKFTHVPFARSFGEYEQLKRIAKEQKAYDFRVACIDLHPSAARYQGLDTVGARHVLTNRYYKDYLAECMRPAFASEEHFTRFQSQQYDGYTTPREDNRDDLLFESFYPDKSRSVDEWQMPMLLAMGVKYVITPKAIAGIDRYTTAPVVDPGARLPGMFAGTRVQEFYSLPIKVYPVRESFPLARFVSGVRRFPSRPEVLKALGQADMTGLQSSLYLYTGDVTSEIRETSGAGKVLEVGRAMDSMTVSGTADGPGYVILAVNFDPRWSCRVNGRESKIFRANHAFQAVSIDRAGPFELVFTYANPALDMSYVSLPIGLLLILGSLFFSIRPTGCDPVPSRGNWLFDLRQTGQRRWLVLGGVGASLVWAIGFFLFVYRGYADVPFAPHGYLLVQLTVMGVLLTGWTWFLSRD